MQLVVAAAVMFVSAIQGMFRPEEDPHARKRRCEGRRSTSKRPKNHDPFALKCQFGLAALLADLEKLYPGPQRVQLTEDRWLGPGTQLRFECRTHQPGE